MALVIPGKALCSLCGTSIADGQPAVAFPAFLGPNHRYHQLSDSAIHVSCFESWPDRAEFEALYEKYRAIWDSRPQHITSLAEMEEWGRKAFAEFM